MPVSFPSSIIGEYRVLIMSESELLQLLESVTNTWYLVESVIKQIGLEIFTKQISIGKHLNDKIEELTYLKNKKILVKPGQNVIAGESLLAQNESGK